VNNSRVGLSEDSDEERAIEGENIQFRSPVREESDEEDKNLGVEEESDLHGSEYYKKRLEGRPIWVVTTFKWALALMREKQWKEALEYVKKWQVLEPDYRKGRMYEAMADIHFNLDNQKWEYIQELTDKAIAKYQEELYEAEDDRKTRDCLKKSIGNVYIKKGKCYEKMKIIEKAIEMYHECLEFDSENPLAYLRVGWAHVRRNKIYEGYNYLKKGLKYKPDSVEIYFKLSETSLMMEDIHTKERQESALKFINAWLKLEPDNLEAMILLGRIKEKQGEYDEAYNIYQKVTDVDRKRPDSFYYLGQLYEKKKEFKKAISAYKQWLFLDTQNFAWAISLATLLGNEGEHHKAAKYFKHAVDINPLSVVARFGLGKTIQNISDNKEAAIEHFDYVIQKDPENYKAYCQLAIVYLDKTNYDKWWEMIKKCLSLNKKYVLGLVTMGNLLFETGNPGQSIKYHKRALKYNPKDIQALIGLGNALYEAGEPANAIKYYKKAIEQDETLSDVHYNLGNAMYLIEDTDGAIKHYRIAIKLNPQKPESYYNLGNALWVKLDYEKAIDYYKEAIELDEYNAPAFYNLGNAYYMISEFDKAIKTYQRALKLNPESAECHFNIASAYNDKGDYLNALHHYKQSLKSSAKKDHVSDSQEGEKKTQYEKDNIETMVWVVQTCKQLRKWDEAKKYISMIKQIDPTNDISLEE
jgi:tetratricopeptide (TPR) repeat protein